MKIRRIGELLVLIAVIAVGMTAFRAPSPSKDKADMTTAETVEYLNTWREMYDHAWRHIGETEWSKAESIARQALAYAEEANDQTNIAKSYDLLGMVHHSSGDRDAAQAAYLSGIQSCRGQESEILAILHNRLALVLLETEKKTEAFEHLEISAQLNERVLKDDPTRLATRYNSTAAVLLQQGRPERARHYCDLALALWETAPKDERAYQATLANKKALDEL